MTEHPTLASVAEKQMPQVSIGMPVYNGEKYIRDALNTLLQQTFADFELIISDNASNDQTESICQKYVERDTRIVYFRQKKNIGAAANFQFVLNRASANIFMWAAYDDEWAKNYLMDATALLDDENIKFIFPTFSIESIRLNIGKKFDKELFTFIESTRRRQRVLQFLALHHNSHKCNIVYSMFRKEFLRAAIKIQEIGNDGALGAVILGLGRGKILSGSLFKKRYPSLWPGALSKFFTWNYKIHSGKFESLKADAIRRLNTLFPEYLDEIKTIFDHYHPYAHAKHYRICTIDEKPSGSSTR